MPFIPPKLLVIGGGIIGLEMATVYEALGSEVSVVEFAEQLVPAADADLVKVYQRFNKDRFNVRLKTKVTGVEATKEGLKSKIYRDCEVESFISGLSLAKKFNKRYSRNVKTNEIFELYRKHNLDAVKFIDEFKINLAMSLSVIINILDPDVFIFGGGVSNEIDFLNEIHSKVSKYVTGKEYEGVFLKPKYGDASGVRGAARLGRTSSL